MYLVINMGHERKSGMKRPMIYAGSRRDRGEDDGGMTGYTGGRRSEGNGSPGRAREDQGETGYTGGRRSEGNATPGTEN